MATPLKNVPRTWLREIEPYIARNERFKDCWIWQGAVDRKGHPIKFFVDLRTKKRRNVRVARVVMALFYNFDDHCDVKHICGNLTCLNPSHMHVSVKHWTQEAEGDKAPLKTLAGDVKPGIDDRRKSV